jgi:hypothetical protein
MRRARQTGALAALVALAVASCRSHETDADRRSLRETRIAAPASRPLALLVEGEPGSKPVPLGLARASVSVLCAGELAATTLDLTFRNDSDRVLEGELLLPLPDGAAVSSFSIETSSGMRAASVVEREKARATFEQVVRRGVDPGLVEWVRGSTFSTRVYPIPAHGTKRVAVEFEQPLVARDAGRLSLRVPLDFGAAVATLEVTVRCASERAPTCSGETALELVPAGGEWLASRALHSTQKLDLALSVPVDPERPQVLVEPAAHGLSGEERVFVASVPVPESAPGAAPARVTLLYDVSRRALGRDRARERAFVAELARRIGTGAIALVPFSDEPWSGAERFAVEQGACPALLERLAALEPEGALRFAKLDLARLRESTDLFVLVSDGLASLDEPDPSLPETPLVAVASGSGDGRALARLARGGTVVRLDTLSPVEAVDRALARPIRLLEAGGAGLRDVLPEAPSAVTGGRLFVTGKLRGGDEHELVLRLGRDDADARTLHVAIPTRGSAATGLAERAWALAELDHLLERSSDSEREIVSLARENGLVTPLTSLLVLDSPADYARYHVPPPPELVTEVAALTRADESAVASSSEARLARLEKWVAARERWWRSDPASVVSAATAAVGSAGGAGALAFYDVSEVDNRSFPAPELGLPQHRNADSFPGPRIVIAGNAPFFGSSSVGGSLGRILDAPPNQESGIETRHLAEANERLQRVVSEEWRSRPDAELSSGGTGLTVVSIVAPVASAQDETVAIIASADALFASGRDREAIRKLSNLAALETGNVANLRTLAWTLEAHGALELAEVVLATVARLRPREPQSWRDLALVEARRGELAPAIAHLERVVRGPWDDRFAEIELVALEELAALDRRARAAGLGKLTTLPDGLLGQDELDLRVVLSWNADDTDVDLWVTEPTGEKACYQRLATRIGGAFGRDFTQGYGPEIYRLRRAVPGTYTIQANAYGDRRQTLGRGVETVRLTVFEDWGKPTERLCSVVARLSGEKTVLDLARVDRR